MNPGIQVLRCAFAPLREKFFYAQYPHQKFSLIITAHAGGDHVALLVVFILRAKGGRS